jgi:hypothetical protein
MGYTHYWQFNKIKGITATELEKRYQQAMRDCHRVIKAYQSYAIGCDRLSGYSAHTSVGQYGGIYINGKQDNAHEPFIMREHFNQNESGGFCKTARKPYDLVVVACLSILKYRLGDSIKIGSDGGMMDWAEGTLWARCVLKRPILNPMKSKKEEAA